MKEPFSLSFECSEEVLELFQQKVGDLKMIMAHYSSAIMEVETKLKVLNEQFCVQQSYNPIETIKTRLKSPESIIEKLRRKHLPLEIKSLEEGIYDIAGVRVICPFVKDIYMLADCLLGQDDVTLLHKKDYILEPKESGYRSLHLIIETPIYLQQEKKNMKVEIQLRTIAMDFWASLEHRMQYKKNIDPSLAEMLMLELKECAWENAKLDEKMERIMEKLEGRG